MTMLIHKQTMSLVNYAPRPKLTKTTNGQFRAQVSSHVANSIRQAIALIRQIDCQSRTIAAIEAA